MRCSLEKQWKKKDFYDTKCYLKFLTSFSYYSFATFVSAFRTLNRKFTFIDNEL